MCVGEGGSGGELKLLKESKLSSYSSFVPAVSLRLAGNFKLTSCPKLLGDFQFVPKKSPKEPPMDSVDIQY